MTTTLKKTTQNRGVRCEWCQTEASPPALRCVTFATGMTEEDDIWRDWHYCLAEETAPPRGERCSSCTAEATRARRCPCNASCCYCETCWPRSISAQDVQMSNLVRALRADALSGVAGKPVADALEDLYMVQF